MLAGPQSRPAAIEEDAGTLKIVELGSTSFFLDFDGTITVTDTGVHLLDRLAPPTWHEIEVLYEEGRIGSRECMSREWELLPRDRDAIEAVVRDVALDDGFDALVGYLRSAGAEITILSDGFGFRAREIAREAEIPVLTNSIDWKGHQVIFPDVLRSCPCAECGTCKRAPILAARERGRFAVLVGDGISDVKGADVADFVFAKGELADWCEAHGVGARRFERLSDVLHDLVTPNGLS